MEVLERAASRSGCSSGSTAAAYAANAEGFDEASCRRMCDVSPSMPDAPVRAKAKHIKTDNAVGLDEGHESDIQPYVHSSQNGELSCRGQKSIQTVLLSNGALDLTDAARASSSKQSLVHNEPAEAILEGTGSGMCAESTFGGDSHLDSCESQGQSHALPDAAEHTTSLNVGFPQGKQSVHRTERDGTHEHGCVTGLAIKD